MKQRLPTRNRNKLQWSKLLIYASLLFVLVWLARSGYLQEPVIRNPWAIALSLILLAIGFLASVLVWWRMLRVSDQAVSWRRAGASVGLTIFGKYIPGKLWSIVGRASYLKDHSGLSLRGLSAISLNAQVLTLWSGLLLGATTFFSEGIWGRLGWGVVALWLLLTLILFTDATRHAIQAVATRLGRHTTPLPHLKLQRIWPVIPAFLLMWISWGVGFAYLAAGLTGATPSLLHGSAFILAATTAIISLLTPGGIGVREGLLVMLLSILGTAAPDATTIAVTSRLWFLLGEVFIFLLGIYWDRAERRTNVSRSGERPGP